MPPLMTYASPLPPLAVHPPLWEMTDVRASFDRASEAGVKSEGGTQGGYYNTPPKANI